MWKANSRCGKELSEVVLSPSVDLTMHGHDKPPGHDLPKSHDEPPGHNELHVHNESLSQNRSPNKPPGHDKPLGHDRPRGRRRRHVDGDAGSKPTIEDSGTCRIGGTPGRAEDLGNGCSPAERPVALPLRCGAT